ncbi:hypothetical protein [Acetobacter oeni]|uniref:Uncharacterized protein n=1 Tax=Acetobacter oeni TaxID=304077 RepID=A0A511XMP9_9PROT|nr:hypothetical protein [Acetobacter oeni]MBB3884135.1 hypothetical protein [Acetobacter oeni]NHO20137.1 hypothetical protein [Acetobacter oeni]GBR04348.1 hypothetical protein AA21952_1396 [Acetobacter oeni LMG 21952]GEN64219.1 hypothetical protein AOE01nite_24430 [Acetobacter oeni]
MKKILFLTVLFPAVAAAQAPLQSFLKADRSLGQYNPLSESVNVGIFPETPSYAGMQYASPVKTILQNNPPVHAWDVPADMIGSGIPWGQVEMLGGHRADDKAFHWVFGQPVAGGLQAVVDAVYMNGMSAGQGSGVTAGGWSGIVNYPELDAVAREERTGSAPPRFIASSTIRDPQGNTHAVTFSRTGASFTPALPAYWAKFLVKGMNVSSNEVAAQKKRLWQNSWLMPYLTSSGSDGKFTRPINTYFGTIAGWHTNTDGTVDSITLDNGWGMLGQVYYGLGSAPHTPGSETLDNSAPSLDHFFTHVNSPAVFFGLYTKAFPEYQLCQLDSPGGSHGDINNPNGSFGNQVNQCANEWDFWNEKQDDYSGTLQGLALDFNSRSALTKDSFGILLSGGGKLPQGFLSTNLDNNAAAYTALGPGGLVTALFQPSDLGTLPGSFSELANFGFDTRPQGNYTGYVSVTQVRDQKMTERPESSNYASQSIHIQYHDSNGGQNISPSANVPWDPASGASGGQVVFNPKGYYHGIGIGAGNNGYDPNYGLIVAENGTVLLPGAKIEFTNTGGDAAGGLLYNKEQKSLYFTTPADFTKPLTVEANAELKGSVSVKGVLNARALIIPYGTPAKGAPCANGQMMMDDTNEYACHAGRWRYRSEGKEW